jgi:serine/threonine-protein kinase RsbW
MVLFMTSKFPMCRSIVTESKPSAVTEVCGWILSKLESENFDSKDIFAVHLAIEEAFLNAVKHGNKNDPDKKVKVEYTINPDRIDITITDDGDGFNPENVPDPRENENLYKPQGRGLLLINTYMDVVEYNDKGNSVHMTKYKDRKTVCEK